MKDEKYLWCPQCNTFPDEITQTQSVTEKRKWDGECYELIDSDTQDPTEYECGECGTTLEVK